MFPSMEVLLRHAVQWLGMKASPAVQQPGVLDNEKDFMDDLFELNEKQVSALRIVMYIVVCTYAKRARRWLHWL